jgi:uncharacterized protein
MFDKLENKHGERLDATYHPAAGLRAEAPPRRLCLLGHGVTANKDRAWAVTLAEALAAAGFNALRFSFSGNGASDGRFEHSCPSKEAADLDAVIAAALTAGAEQLVYIGHSMGAAVGVMVAAREERLTALVSLGGMVHTRSFAERKFGALTPGRDTMWAKPECPLSQRFLDDMATIDTVAPCAESIRIPWLLVHGQADTVVPSDESKVIAARSAGPVQVVIAETADHVFSGAAADAMASVVVAWLSTALSTT